MRTNRSSHASDLHAHCPRSSIPRGHCVVEGVGRRGGTHSIASTITNQLAGRTLPDHIPIPTAPTRLAMKTRMRRRVPGDRGKAKPAVSNGTGWHSRRMPHMPYQRFSVAADVALIVHAACSRNLYLHPTVGRRNILGHRRWRRSMEGRGARGAKQPSIRRTLLSPLPMKTSFHR